MNHLKEQTSLWLGAAFALTLGGLSACAKARPTEDECRAGLRRAAEVEIDQLPSAMANAGIAPGDMPVGPNGQSAQDMLKSRVDLLVTPAAVADCENRANQADMQCAATAASPDDMVKRCHWKDLPGGKIGY